MRRSLMTNVSEKIKEVKGKKESLNPTEEKNPGMGPKPKTLDEFIRKGDVRVLGPNVLVPEKWLESNKELDIPMVAKKMGPRDY